MIATKIGFFGFRVHFDPLKVRKIYRKSLSHASFKWNCNPVPLFFGTQNIREAENLPFADIYDEVDEMMLPNQELIYAEGSPIALKIIKKILIHTLKMGQCQM